MRFISQVTSFFGEGEKALAKWMHVLKRYEYLAFVAPFALAFLSWLYFPVVAQWVLANIFGYAIPEQQQTFFGQVRSDSSTLGTLLLQLASLAFGF